MSPFYQYVATGGIALGGDAFVWTNNLGVFTVYGGGAASLVSLEADFAGEDPAPVLSGASKFVNAGCGCGPLPPVLQVFHNLPDVGGLSDFLSQNGLTLSDELTVQYSRLTNSWRSNVHLRGIGNNGETETWTIFMEWQCTSNIGSFDLGTNIWKFGVLLTRKNEGLSQDYDTRILVGFSPDGVCGDGPFRFEFDLNTNTELITVTGDTIVNTEILYDEAGVFRSAAWLKKPVLVIRIAEANTIEDENRLDLTETTPVFNALS